jgi:anaerobic magnesium-protoporphyrin IX monomethyl ester cyclase
MNKALVMWPLQIPTYFNAGHHLALYQVSGHLKKTTAVTDVHVIDGAVEQVSWKDLVLQLVKHEYQLVAVQCDLEGIEGTERSLSYLREFCPQAKIVAFGRMASMVPHTLRGFDFDAIVESGDFEPGVAAAFEALMMDSPSAPGIAFRAKDGGWLIPSARGARLPASDWYLPLPTEIPFEEYDTLYRDDKRRFSGLPYQRELVVPVARGCPIGCEYCEVPGVFGNREIRIDVQRALNYIQTCFGMGSFDYISFYAPTFTLDRRWVIDLCDQITRQFKPMRWKCCTTLHHLDEDLIRRMGSAGCTRISVGLETLEVSSLDLLPIPKKRGASHLADIAQWCTEAGIELNCFIVIGLPNSTLTGTAESIRAVRQIGARVRPTIYTDWNNMLPGLSEAQLARFNRHILPSGFNMDPGERKKLYRLLTGSADP